MTDVSDAVPKSPPRARVLCAIFGLVGSTVGCAGGVGGDDTGYVPGPTFPSDDDREGTGGGTFDDDGGPKSKDELDTGSGEDGDEGGLGETGAGVPMGDCNAGEVMPCYSGPAGTQDIGGCASGQISCVGGQWGPCEGEVHPSAELCDGIDNDCNGQADDGVGGGGACSTGQPGPCGQGQLVCAGGSMSCQSTTSPAAEVCGDGVDNDCNGQVDNGCSSCAHDPCLPGPKLSPGCDPCVALICLIDSFCCNTEWDLQCVAEVALTCGENC